MLCRNLWKVVPGRGHAQQESSEGGLSYLRNNKGAVGLEQRWRTVPGVLGTHLQEVDAEMELGVPRIARENTCEHTGQWKP